MTDKKSIYETDNRISISQRYPEHNGFSGHEDLKPISLVSNRLL